jgi:dihydrofolate reductase
MMRKLIAAINMTLDGFCDHTSGIVDDEIHQHYNDLLRSAGTILYGRITYQLMEYWQTVVKDPTGNKPMDDFAVTIDNIPKVVFYRTLKNVDQITTGWKTARLAKKDLKEEVLELRQSPNGEGKDILVGSRSLIVALMNYNLIDELQLCIHPVVAGKGLPLFENIHDKNILTLIKTKTFGSGAVILYYVPRASTSSAWLRQAQPDFDKLSLTSTSSALKCRGIQIYKPGYISHCIYGEGKPHRR